VLARGALLALAIGVLLPVGARADVIHLRNGNYYRVGAWRDAGDAIEFYKLGGTVRIPKEDVLRIEPEAPSPSSDVVEEIMVPAAGGSTRAAAASARTGPSRRPSVLSELLKATPPALLIMYLDKSMLAMAGELNPNPVATLQQLGLASTPVDRLVISTDFIRALSGQGGAFAAVEGPFTASSVATVLEQAGASKKAQRGDFTLYASKAGQQEGLTAVKDKLVLAGAPADVNAGLSLQAGRGASAYAAAGVQGAVERAGEGPLAVVFIAPPGAEKAKAGGLEATAMVIVVSEVAADRTVTATVVLACPGEEDAKAAMADLKRQADAQGARRATIVSIKTDGAYVVARMKGSLNELSAVGQRQ
jgi:hypothetical protein